MKKYTIVTYWVRRGDDEHYDHCWFPITQVDDKSSDVELLVASGWLESADVADERYDEMMEAYWGAYGEAVCAVSRTNTVTQEEFEFIQELGLLL